MNKKHEPDWESIRAKKQKLINANNAKRKPHECKVGDKILLKTASNTKFGEDPCEGPYDILHANDSGTITHQKGILRDAINMRNIHPFKN